MFFGTLLLQKSYAFDISEAEALKQQLQKRNEELSKELEELKKSNPDLETKRNVYSENILVVQQQIDLINQHISKLESNLKLKNQEIENKKSEIAKNVEVIKQRIRAIYTSGETSTLDILLGSTGLEDLFNKTEMLKIVSNHDKKLIDNLRVKLDLLQTEKANLEKRHEEMKQLKTELFEKQQELNELLEENKFLTLVNTANENVIYDIMDKNDEELKRIEAEIAKYYQNIRNHVIQSPDTGIKKEKNMFAWPVPGFTYISSYWGDNRNHEAIDIAGANIYGSKIVSAADGVVMSCNTSGWGGGYGNYVMIDHGNGYATLYAHMSYVEVSLGQSVKRNQTIGYVGSTGDSTGPHLHFEVRVDGVRKNPLDYYT